MVAVLTASPTRSKVRPHVDTKSSRRYERRRPEKTPLSKESCRAPRKLARESGGRWAARFGARRTGAAVVPHLWHPLLRTWPSTLCFVRAGFCRGLLVQGPRRLSLLQRPPDG